MKDNATDDTVIERLGAALEGDALPKAAQDYARHLLNRLSQPVRVSILGLPGSGKSQIVNMFVGESLVPKGVRLPTTEYVWGETPQMIVTSNDGSLVTIPGTDFEAISGRNAAFLRVEVPASILQRINLLEVVTDGTPGELSSGVDWVVRRTDIALWCSQDFDATERAVWRRVPDSLKDHAFLVLSKADVLSAENLLSRRVAELETVVAEEFHSLFAVATLQAIRAFRNGGVDEAMFHASGGGALTSEVLRHAERGRRADFDSAHMFLARYQVKEGGRPTSRDVTPSRPVEAESRGAEAPVARPAQEPEIRPAAETPVQPAATERAAPAPAPAAAAAPAPAVAAAPEPRTKVENVTLFVDAIRYLKRRGETLSETASTIRDGRTKPLLDQCVDAVEHLVDLFSQDDSGCAASEAFFDELAEAQDVMVLMQVEEGDTPAADAVTLLLQLRRDMEMQLAA